MISTSLWLVIIIITSHNEVEIITIRLCYQQQQLFRWDSSYDFTVALNGLDSCPGPRLYLQMIIIICRHMSFSFRFFSWRGFFFHKGFSSSGFFFGVEEAHLHI